MKNFMDIVLVILMTFQIILAIIMGYTLLKSSDMHIALKIFNIFGLFCAGFNVATLTKTEE